MNRANLREVPARHYELVVCCGAPGTKWKANLHPEADRTTITDLIVFLYTRVHADKFVLVSTADVFGQPVDADERDTPFPDCPYGENRLWLEGHVRKCFPHANILRLPGVDGPGLKKNALYDLRTESHLDQLNPASVYQWYDVRNLWRDVGETTVPLRHLCPPPESLGATVARDFPHLAGRLTGTGKPAFYNLRTLYRDRTDGR